MKAKVWLVGLVLAMGLVNLSYGHEGVFEAMRDTLPRFFERVVVPGSTFHLGRGHEKLVDVPYGPRDISKLFIQAQTNGCALADIEVVTFGQGREKSYSVINVNGYANWFYIPVDSEAVHKILVRVRSTSSFANTVKVDMIQADLGPTAIDPAFRPGFPSNYQFDFKPWNSEHPDYRNFPGRPGGEGFARGEESEYACFSSEQLADRIRRYMPRDGKYLYLTRNLERLVRASPDLVEFGDDEVKEAMKPVLKACSRVESKALAQGDGSRETLEKLELLRIAMLDADEFVEKRSLTKITKGWAQGFWVIGEIIDVEARFFWADGEGGRHLANPIPLPPSPQKIKQD